MASRKGLHLASILRKEGISNELVLSTIANVPRERFLPATLTHKAYENTALPIGQGQTISQPYIVAKTAVLASIFSEVCSVERIKSLQFQAKRRLNQLDLHNIKMKHGDGWQGWLSKGPFDAIIVTAAASDLPQKLIEQLSDNGRLVIPVGKHQQNLMCFDKVDNEVKQTIVEIVNFVPLVAGDIL
jgi:protein-L-isoaspartate(D-aspartate) O-methyltransferase